MAPTQLAPQPKPTISVEEWEARAPLGDLEIKSIAAIKLASEQIPLPSKFSPDELGSSRPSTPSVFQRNKPAPGSSRPNTPLSGSTRSATHALHPKQPIQTPQHFYDWFALIDRSVAHSQEAHFRAHVANVSEHLAACDTLVEKIDLVDQEVDGMLDGWKGVEDGGKSLKDASEKLLEERDKLLELTEEIGIRLEYFQELDHATRMLNHPGESLVLQTDFLYMVERVDVCIDYLKAHRHFREAEIYLFRYQQCMTRAMTLIKMYFVGSLRALSVDVSKRMSEKDVSTTAQMHLLYTRFKTVSSQLLPLLSELERRARSHPQELSALLDECHTAYFSVRKSLLVGRIMEEIKGLDPSRTELVELTRAGQYLETLCDHLYDDLRPRILHEPRLTALCEVCTVLQALMVLDVSSVHGDDDDESPVGNEDELALDLGAVNLTRKTRGLGRLHISHLLEMVLQDAQTRLFFKAQSVIQSDIRYYVPQPEDLAYPDILVGKLCKVFSWRSDRNFCGVIAAERPATGPIIEEKASVSELFRLSSTEKQDTWYPTLRKTVWVLSQLHDFVKPAIFEDIAQEAISLCRQSLVAAADLLRVKAPLDSQLFLARHLLLLKEVTQNLDLSQGEAEGSGSYVGMTDTLASMLSKTTSLLPDALFASLGMPRSDESIQAAKHGIDHDLRHACESIITLCTDPITQPLHEWAIVPAGKGGSVAEQSKPSARDVVSAFERACMTELRAHAGRLRLYLEDSRTVTVRVLLEHVRERVGDAYEAFWEASGSGRGGDEVMSLPVGVLVDLYVPRKCSATNRLITSKDHASVQISIVDVDANGIALNTSTSFALCGQVRSQGESDDSINRLATKAGLLRNVWSYQKLTRIRKALSRPIIPSRRLGVGSGAMSWFGWNGLRATALHHACRRTAVTFPPVIGPSSRQTLTSSRHLAFARTSQSLYSPRWVNPKNGQEIKTAEESQAEEQEQETKLEEDKPSDSAQPPPDSSSSAETPAAPPDSPESPPPTPPPSKPASGSIAKQSVPEVYPQVLALPIARRPLFPGFYKAVVIKNPHVVAAIKEMMKRGQPYLGAFLLKDENADSDVITDINSVHPVGVLAQITSVFAPQGSKEGEEKEEGLTAVLYPHRRIKITNLVKAGGIVTLEDGEPQTVEPPAIEGNVQTNFLFEHAVSIVHVDNLVTQPYNKDDQYIRAFMSEIVSVFKDIAQLNPLFRDQITNFSINQVASNVFDEPDKLADFAAAVSSGEVRELQDVLESLVVDDRLRKALLVLKKELINAQLQSKLSRDVDSKIAKRQREYYLMEQLKGIKKELGMESDGKDKLIEKFKERASTLKMPEIVRKVFDEELSKLASLEPAASEASVTRNYLEWITQIPWGTHTPENFSLPHAQGILDADHYGLTDIKSRILEFLAVGKLRGSVQGKIICLVGPPGVGKTSIGKSIAGALGRRFFRFSVGGLTDVAEIKGHRRTYVGALPGKIIQALKRVGTENPLVLIDEVDKIGRGINGDPASALLEMLDPEQNNSFLDH
ncbi:hypothetical protein H0H87_005710 [Tephrocybe sp. NHM501043]|nr:hypothetical protein H0H87_005710 [Tephrocybe sp. NHM501043]